MIILHGAFAQGRFFLWAESPPQSAVPDSVRKVRKPSGLALQPSRFPYDAGARVLHQKLLEAGLEFSGNSDAELLISIPTIRSVPIASSPLIAVPPRSAKGASLQVWTVNSSHLKPAEAIELLCHCVDRELLAPGLIVGRDLTFWAAAMRLGAGIVVRQQFLPGIAKTNKTYRGRWEPVFTASDQHRLLRLGEAMPHVCRAASLESTTARDIKASRLLSDFISFVVDCLVRDDARAASPPIALAKGLGGPLPKEESHHSIHDHWLHALSSSDGVIDLKTAQTYLPVDVNDLVERKSATRF